MPPNHLNPSRLVLPVPDPTKHDRLRLRLSVRLSPVVIEATTSLESILQCLKAPRHPGDRLLSDLSAWSPPAIATASKP